MAKKRYAIGKIVNLKSGGPKMTVLGYAKNGQAECGWFEEDGRQRQTTFPDAALIATPVKEFSDQQLKAIILKDTFAQQSGKSQKPKKI